MRCFGVATSTISWNPSAKSDVTRERTRGEERVNTTLQLTTKARKHEPLFRFVFHVSAPYLTSFFACLPSVSLSRRRQLVIVHAMRCTLTASPERAPTARVCCSSSDTTATVWMLRFVSMFRQLPGCEESRRRPIDQGCRKSVSRYCTSGESPPRRCAITIGIHHTQIAIYVSSCERGLTLHRFYDHTMYTCSNYCTPPESPPQRALACPAAKTWHESSNNENLNFHVLC